MARSLGGPRPTRKLNPFLCRSVHIAAPSSRAGSRQAMVTLLDDVAMHAPGCQCHGCGASSLTGMSLGSQRGWHRVPAKAGARRQFGAAAAPTTDYAFEMAASSIRYGRGVTAEVRTRRNGFLRLPLPAGVTGLSEPRHARAPQVGMDMENLGCDNVMVLTDKNLAELPVVSNVLESLERAGRKVGLFDRVEVEPTNKSFQDAIDYAKAQVSAPRPLPPPGAWCSHPTPCRVMQNFDGFISVGGGSVMDTAKAASLYSTFPDAVLLDFVNAPVGKGLPVPGQLRPHIAIPTTAGTGSETTGQAIFDHEPLSAKTGIGNRALKPTLGIIDPANMETMPQQVAIASGFDVLCHALESYTAVPYQQRSPRPLNPNLRPAYQGSNPISDVWCVQALKMLAESFTASVLDRDNTQAKEQMCLAATYAGVGFGNAGVHLCHGMSYPISGLNKKFEHVQWQHPEYTSDPTPTGLIVPHGISVVLSAPAVFEFTAAVDPERHLLCAELLGAVPNPTTAVTPEYAGGLLKEQILKLMDATGVPMGISKLGFTHGDIDALVAGTLPQERVTKLSPNPVGGEELAHIFEAAMEY